MNDTHETPSAFRSGPSRNDPCPCGSGLKFKQCCIGKTPRPAPSRVRSGAWLWRGFLAIVILGGVAVLAIDPTGGGVENGAASNPGFGGLPSSGSGTTPDPWFYDQAANRHWHAGHAHWHDGPPPPAAQRGGVTPATAGTLPGQGTITEPGSGSGLPTAGTPAPWQYDAANDQHWHAGHGHWHPGPPPPPDQRQ